MIVFMILVEFNSIDLTLQTFYKNKL